MKGKTKMKTTTNTHVVKSETGHPQAWIAIKRNRQKIYTGQGKFPRVYLKDGQEFQLELYNPTQTRYLVKIKINGNYNSERGLILNPGQRYFLDRFVDEDRRLTFSTYDVEDNDEVQKAIERNGLVEVEFHAETFLHGSILTYPSNIWWGGSTPSTNPPYWYTNGGNFNLTVGSNTTFTTGGSTVNNISYLSNGNSGVINTSSNYSSVVNDQSIETGRVERGKKSDQSFENGFGSFNAWAAYTTTLQVIPLSQKPVESHEVRSYCTGCGSRIKKQTWKFCPNCGTETI
jgi:hypothetical protein